jgi:hypothetical protein
LDESVMKSPQLVKGVNERIMQRFKVSFRLPFRVTWSARGKSYLLHASSLNLFSQCGKKEDAQNAMAGAISLFLSGCMESNCLENVLTELGFTEIEPGQKISAEQTYIEICHDQSRDRFQPPATLLNSEMTVAA